MEEYGMVGNIFVVYLPPNVTSVIQPMDQGVIQNFKVNYRKSFMPKLVNYDDGSIPDIQKAVQHKRRCLYGFASL